MKRIVLAAIVTAAMAAPGISGAEHGTFEKSGTLAQANYLAVLGEPYAAAAAACDPEGQANGTDGIWYDITGFAGHTATLTPVGDTTDVDAFFYTKNDQGECVTAIPDQGVDSNMGQGFIAATSAATGDAVEVGIVPPTAQYIFVAYFFGPPGGQFTLKIV